MALFLSRSISLLMLVTMLTPLPGLLHPEAHASRLPKNRPERPAANPDSRPCENLLQTPSEKPKEDRRAWQGMTVILDTNVLLINPRALFDFPGARVVIHNQVLRELDKKKKDRSENRSVAPNARRAARVIEQLQSGRVGDPNTNILQLKQSGGLIVFDTNDYVTKLPPSTTQGVLDPEDPDDRIIATALYYDIQNRERKGEVFDEAYSRQVVFISQDVQAKTKTRVKGVASDEYEAAGGAHHSREEVNDEIYSGSSLIKINPKEYHELTQKKAIARLELHRLLRLGMNSEVQLYPNQYVIFVRPDDEAQMKAMGENHKPLGTAALNKNQLLGSYNAESDTIEILPPPEQLHMVIQPRNLEQRMLVHALTTPRIRQVTVLGKAGTGKTLLTLMAGKEQSDPNRKSQNKEFFKQMILMRTLDKVGGEEIGFLPGELEDKVGPAMQSYYDNLEVLLSLEKGRGQNGDSSPGKQSNGESNGGDKGAVERFLRSGQVQIQVMGFVRGRSIQNRFLVIDEAQNLDPGNMKTILTRPGEGTKLVVMGDIGQIDSPFLNLYNNGLTDLVNRIRSLWDRAREDGVLLRSRRLHQSAVVRLEQGERSELAEFMTELYESEGLSR